MDLRKGIAGGELCVFRFIIIKMKSKTFWLVGIIGVIVLVGVVWLYLGQGQKDTWEGVYYPNGCLTCEDDYLFSPEFNDPISCMNWASEKKIIRKNAGIDVFADLAECGRSCEWREGLMVCKETVGISL